MMFASKLILLAAALSAVAFAAPRTSVDAVAEETILVQAKAYQGRVDSLKKQFSELQVSLKSKSYAEVTPGVKSTIDRMVRMIEGDPPLNDGIEPAIKEAHGASQKFIDTEMLKIQTYRNSIFDQQKILYGQADNIRTFITEHNGLVVNWRDSAEKRVIAADDWTKTHNEKTTTCCAKDNAAVVDVAYLSPYHECDFKNYETSDGCISRATDNVQSYVEPYFTDKRNNYLQLVKSCDRLGNLTVTKHEAYQAADQECDSFEEKTRSKADLIAEETTQFEKGWAALRSGYRTTVAIMEDTYNGHKAQVLSDEEDRKNEWKSSQIIKCMLINYKSGGGFNDDSLTKCQDNISRDHLIITYPQMVDRITWVLEEFAPLSEYDHDDTCHADVVQEDPVCEIAEAKRPPECTKDAQGATWGWTTSGVPLQLENN